MDLYFMRHGIAVERIPGGKVRDADRQLTSPGRKKVRQIAAGLKRIAPEIDAILSSPFLRARQTAELVAKEFGIDPIEFSRLLEPQANIPALLDMLKDRASDAPVLLLVGHEPHMTNTVSTLLTGSTGLPLHFRKGGIIKVRINDAFQQSSATLEWLLPPRSLIRG